VGRLNGNSPCTLKTDIGSSGSFKGTPVQNCSGGQLADREWNYLRLRRPFEKKQENRKQTGKRQGGKVGGPMASTKNSRQLHRGKDQTPRRATANESGKGGIRNRKKKGNKLSGVSGRDQAWVPNNTYTTTK